MRGRGLREHPDGLDRVGERVAQGAHPKQAPGEHGLGAGRDREVLVTPRVRENHPGRLEGTGDVVAPPGLVGQDEARPGRLVAQVMAAGDLQHALRPARDTTQVGVAAGFQVGELGGECGQVEVAVGWLPVDDRGGVRSPGVIRPGARQVRAREREVGELHGRPPPRRAGPCEPVGRLARPRVPSRCATHGRRRAIGHRRREPLVLTLYALLARPGRPPRGR